MDPHIHPSVHSSTFGAQATLATFTVARHLHEGGRHIHAHYIILHPMGQSLNLVAKGRADQSTTALVTVATTNAFALTAAVYIASSASGGHVNPAVTFGLAIGGHITIPAAIFYWIAQLTDATLACFLLKAFAVSQPVLVYAIATELSGFSASVVKGVATLVLTVYAASDPRRVGSGRGIRAVVIGLVCGAGVLAIGPFSACAFGASVASGRFRNQTIYWVGPLVGAAIGGLLYENVMFPSNGNEDIDNVNRAGV